MAVAPSSMPVRFSLEWRPAWKDALLEDGELQQKAAERLAAYINEGRVYHGSVGPKPVRVTAEPVELEPHSTGWGVLLHVEAEVKVSFGE